MKRSFVAVFVFSLVALTLLAWVGPLPTARATTSTYTAVGVVITQGSTVSGTYVSTQADDASYHRVTQAWGGGTKPKYLELYYVLGPFSIANESWMSRIDTRWQAKMPGTDVYPKLYWRDFDASAWVDMGEAAFGETDTNVDDYQTSNLNRFRNSTGYFWIRAYVTCSYMLVLGDLYSDYIYVTYTWATPNSDPVNTQASCKNAMSGDGGDTLYARRTAYLYTSNCSDANGYADIHYVDLSMVAGATVRWTARYTEDTNSYSITVGSTYAYLGSCSAVRSGNWVNITWNIGIDWAHPAEDNDNLKLYTEDTAAASDTDTYTANLDVEPRLDIDSFDIYEATGTTNRGNINGYATAQGYIWYYGSLTYSPYWTEVDAWVSCSDVAGSPWGQTTGTIGFISITVQADDVVGQDTYTVKVVAEAAGAGGTDLCHATHSDTYIADRVQVASMTTPDARININEASDGRASLIYDYDDSVVSTGTVTVNGLSATYWSFDQTWRWGETKSSVQAVTYDTVVHASDPTHGVTAVDQNGKSVAVIWDRVQVQSLTANDTWTGINSYAQITVTLWYDYDNTPVTDGSVIAAGAYSFTHIGSGVWRRNDTSASVCYHPFSSFAVSGNSYGITSLDMNGYGFNVIFDRVTIYHAYSNDTTPDGIFPRVNTGSYVIIYWNILYEYSSTKVTTGHPTANGTALTYYPGLQKWGALFTYSGIGKLAYDVVWYGDDDAQIVPYYRDYHYCTWDRVDVTFAAMTYWKLPPGVNATGIVYTRVYAYDSSVFGGTVTLNDTDFAHAVAGRYGYGVASISGCPYGITAFYSNNQTVIWETVSLSVSYTWMRVTGGEYWVRLDLINLAWSVEATTIPDAAVFTFFENASLFHTASPNSGQLIDVVEDYNAAWYYVTWTVKITYTVAPYSFTAYLFVSVGPVEVPVEHTLYIETFDSGLTDYYFSFYVETNWRNACCSVWVNGSSMVYFASEGWHQIAKPTGLGVWNITILVNGTSPLGAAYQHYGLGTGGGWKYRWTLIEVQAETTLFFYFYDLNGEPISWGSEAQPFLVYVNGTQAPHQGLWIRSSVSTVNITIVDLWGYNLYTNTSYAIETVGDTVVRLQLTMWRLILVNRQLETCYAVVEWNLHNRTFYVDKGGFAPLNVYAGSLEVWWYKSSDGQLIAPGEVITLTADFICYTPYVPEVTTPGGGGAQDTGVWWTQEPWPTLILAAIIAIVGAGILIAGRRNARKTQVLIAGPQPEPEPEATPESVMAAADQRQQEQLEESVRQMSGKPPKKKRRSKKH